MKGKGLALAVTAGILVFSSTLLIGQTADTESPVTTISEPVDFTTAAEQTINGVVSIKGYATPRGYSRQGQQQQYVDPFFEYFFGPGFSQRGQRQQPQAQEQLQEQPLGLGSGVILSPDGYIVTNNHVIDGADRLDVTLNDNRTFNATVIGTDPTTDLALIKIEAEGLPVIKFGDSEGLKVGEWVLAVGNPFGFTSTVTAGIVSAKGRSISSLTQNRQMGIESFIQTDAAVNPGNSGGALVNTRGELVGTNTAIYSQTGNYAGHSFAIPTSIVSKVMGDLKKYGTVQRAVLGIETGELTSKLAEQEGITAVTAGLYVGKVVEGGAAAEAGLLKGDVITGLNGHPTHTFGELQEQLSKYSPGNRISVQYVRDNRSYSVTVTLRNGQGNTRITKAGSVSDLGAVFGPVSKDRMAQLNIRNGVEVKELSAGKLKDAGVKEGYIIIEINNGKVNSAADIEAMYKAIMKAEGYDKVMFITGVYPSGRRFYCAVDLTD